MTDYRNRLIVFGMAALLVLGGFAFGRWTSTETVQAINAGTPATTASPAPALASAPASEAQAFYLTDYKAGYSEGYQAGTTGQGTGLATTTREGYNEGFKKGFADGFQARNVASVSAVPNQLSSTEVRPAATRVAYRTAYRERPVFVERKRGSKLKTILTIAAPAAIGAGVGAAVGGGRGAGAGALIGGGGGALWHLLRNRN